MLLVNWLNSKALKVISLKKDTPHIGNVKVENVVKEYANGVYDAKISIPNPKAFKDPNAKPFLEKEGREKLVLRDLNNSSKGK